MSAFIVTDLHINAIVSYAVKHRISFTTAEGREVLIERPNAEEIGRILMDENVRSVCHRYPYAADDEKSAGADYRYEPFPVQLTEIEAIKCCQCLDYQSCETEDWPTTLAFRILVAIKTAAGRNHTAIEKTPAWDAAPWGLSERNVSKLKNAA